MNTFKRFRTLFIGPIIFTALYIIWWIVYGALAVSGIDVPPQVILQMALIPIYYFLLYGLPMIFVLRSLRKILKDGANTLKESSNIARGRTDVLKTISKAIKEKTNILK